MALIRVGSASDYDGLSAGYILDSDGITHYESYSVNNVYGINCVLNVRGYSLITFTQGGSGTTIYNVVYGITKDKNVEVIGTELGSIDVTNYDIVFIAANTATQRNYTVTLS